MESALLKAAKMFSSCVELASIIGVSAKRLDRWLNGNINVPLEYAMAIEGATRRKVTWQELVTNEVNEVMVNANSLLGGETSYSVPYVEIAIEKVNIASAEMKYREHKRICIDENNTLIFGLEILNFYKNQKTKKVPVRRLTFLHLAGGCYGKKLVNIFSPIERAQIGIALEKYLGERRGRKNMHNYAHFNVSKGTKTRELVAENLCFGSHFTYQQIKNVLQKGCSELIDAANQEKISISKGARLAKLSQAQQLQTLKPKNN